MDDPERLKGFLYKLWKKDKIRYVLLVGDADVLPVRYMVLDRKTTRAYDYAFYPSDLYYADLAERDGAFEDWNAREDSFVPTVQSPTSAAIRAASLAESPCSRVSCRV